MSLGVARCCTFPSDGMLGTRNWSMPPWHRTATNGTLLCHAAANRLGDIMAPIGTLSTHIRCVAV
jgi:hypothetical protein